MKKINLLIHPAAVAVIFLAFGASTLLSACGKHDNRDHHSHGDEHSMHFEGGVPHSVSDAYLAIQSALASDRLDQVAGNAEILERETGIEGAASLAEADDIESARDYFHTVSAHLIKAVQKHGAEDEELRLAHCPMAFDYEGGSWLQVSEPLANPYYGARMLRCGEFQDL